MVLCQFFINNSCRFGSKCNNEHFDVKATIRSEMDVAIKGKQWPLSCFGPFKEKTNLIPSEFDQSFEEVRLQCLEAKANNTFPAYEQQLMQRIQQANMRMQAIMNVQRDVIQSVVAIYDDKTGTEGTKQFAGSTPSAASIFGATPTNPQSSGFQQSASIFGGGGGNTLGGGFSQPAGAGIFGGATNQTSTQNTASIFGQSTSSNTGNIFGQAASNQGFDQTSSIFGGAKSTFGASTQSSASIFGAGGTSAPASNSVFGQPQQQSIFGGGTTSNTGIFGGGSATTQTSSPFGQPASTFNAPPPSFSAATQQPSAFGGMAPAVTTSPFASTPVNASPFGAPQPTGLFASANAQLHQPQGPPPNPFGQPIKQQQQQMGGQQNPFGNLGQNAVQAAQQAALGNVFGGGQTMGQATGPPPPAFGQTQSIGFGAPTSTGFGSLSAPQQVASSENSSLYSKMEELTPEQLAAFQADEFVLGKIPNVPPPRELCI